MYIVLYQRKNDSNYCKERLDIESHKMANFVLVFMTSTSFYIFALRLELNIKHLIYVCWFENNLLTSTLLPCLSIQICCNILYRNKYFSDTFSCHWVLIVMSSVCEGNVIVYTENDIIFNTNLWHNTPYSSSKGDNSVICKCVIVSVFGYR